MKSYEYIFFDLDGTLTDSELGILNSFKFACDKFKINYSELDLRTVLGPPLMDSFMSLTEGNREISESAIKCYREHFNPYGMLYENKLYDGILDMLEELNQMSYKLFIATSKPEVFAIKIAEHFGITKLFKGIYGASLDGTRVHKDDILSFALEQNGNQFERSVMIGDRMYDLSAANKQGIDAIGVLYGYGSREELIEHKYVFLADSPPDITEFFKR